MKIIQLIFCSLLTMFLCGFGCSSSKPTPDPLAGWHFCFSQDPKDLGKIILADYQDYIQKLPPEEKKFVGTTHTFEDGTGQHAVRIEIGLNGTWWEHVLIYDKDNKRIKLIKYTNGRYAS
ncbi:MAG TPA: hypothetical protein VN516_02920 [Candidatus Baltobacteraceae bacterium]|nr:hypothetical protein [Candidatus Baltobacteraceae bacterium]